MMRLFIMPIIVLFISSCNLFSKDERLLGEYQKSNGERIGVYYLSLGATTNDVIQVRKSNQDNCLWVSENYNYLKSGKLINDTILQLVLTDTSVFNSYKKLDTIIISTK